MRRARVPIIAHFRGFGDRPPFDDILPLARLIARRVRVPAPTIRSTSSSPASSRPWSSGRTWSSCCRSEPSRRTSGGIPGSQFIFEPTPAAVLDELLPRYVGTRLYQTALESVASFFSSQMVAMKNATENADELIEDLTLSYNKARQANITRELIEIASGARAR